MIFLDFDATVEKATFAVASMIFKKTEITVTRSQKMFAGSAWDYCTLSAWCTDARNNRVSLFDQRLNVQNFRALNAVIREMAGRERLLFELESLVKTRLLRSYV